VAVRQNVSAATLRWHLWSGMECARRMTLTAVLGMNLNVWPVSRVTRMPLQVSSDLNGSAKSGERAADRAGQSHDRWCPRVEGRGAAVVIGLPA
jgi:hypothetical protein